jgi:hypothetical protein
MQNLFCYKYNYIITLLFFFKICSGWNDLSKAADFAIFFAVGEIND